MPVVRPGSTTLHLPWLITIQCFAPTGSLAIGSGMHLFRALGRGGSSGLLLVPVRGEHDCWFRCGATAEHDEGQNWRPYCDLGSVRCGHCPSATCSALGLSRQLLLVCGSALLKESGRRNGIVEGPFRDPIPPAFYLARLSRAFFVLGSFWQVHTFRTIDPGVGVYGTERGPRRPEDGRSLFRLTLSGHTRRGHS